MNTVFLQSEIFAESKNRSVEVEVNYFYLKFEVILYVIFVLYVLVSEERGKYSIDT